MPIATASITPIQLVPTSARPAKRGMRPVESTVVSWSATGIGVWAATLDGEVMGTVEETRAYGFVIRDEKREWVGSFSMLSDAMWFLPLAARAKAA